MQTALQTFQDTLPATSLAGKSVSTCQLILDTALQLFNAHGESNTTMTALALKLRMSPGNLYYHFRNKDHVVEVLFSSFKKQLQTALAPKFKTTHSLSGFMELIRSVSEVIWRFRFFYKGINDLVSRNRQLETEIRDLLSCKTKAFVSLCNALRSHAVLIGSPEDLETAAKCITLILSYWPSHEYICNPRAQFQSADVQQVIDRACDQTKAVLAPFTYERYIKERLVSICM